MQGSFSSNFTATLGKGGAQSLCLHSLALLASLSVSHAATATELVSPGAIRIEAESYDASKSTDLDLINYGNEQSFLGGPDVWSFSTNRNGKQESGFAVKRTRSGETLTYPVNINTAGFYDITASIASAYDKVGGIQVFIDGSLAGNWNVERTKNADDYVIGHVGSVLLDSGQHTIQVVFVDGGGMSFDWLALTPVLAEAPLQVTTIEAESYDARRAVDYETANLGNAQQFTGGPDVLRHITSSAGFQEEGYVIRDFRVGEKLVWHTGALEAGNYLLNVRAAAVESLPGALSFTIDGQPLGMVDVDSTGHWWRFKDLAVGSISLDSQAHTIEMTVLNEGKFSMDSLSLTPTQVNTQPFGRFLEAESYDQAVDTDDDFGNADTGKAVSRFKGVTDVYNHAGGPDGPPRTGQIVGRTRDHESLRWNSVGLAAGIYKIEMSYATGNTDAMGSVQPGDVEVWIDGEYAVALENLEPTGHWWSFKEQLSGEISIPAGNHTVEMRFVNGARMNVDWFRFVPVRECGGVLANDMDISDINVLVEPADNYGVNLVKVAGDQRLLQNVLDTNPGKKIGFAPGCYNVRRAMPQTKQTLLGLRDTKERRPVFHGQDRHNRGITTPALGDTALRTLKDRANRDTRKDVTVSGIEISHYQPGNAYFGALHVVSYKSGTPRDLVPGEPLNWTLTDLVVTDNDGVGVVVAPGTTLSHSTIANNTQLGIYGGGGSGIVLTHLDVYGNSSFKNMSREAKARAIWFHGGAIKLVRAVNAEVSWSHIHDNVGQGVWLDVVSNDPYVHHNLLERNSGIGIMHEISFGGTIENNVILDHGWSDLRTVFSEHVWPAGIAIATSRNVTVRNNHIDQSSNRLGNYTSSIGIVAQDRGVHFAQLLKYVDSTQASDIDSPNTLFVPDKYRKTRILNGQIITLNSYAAQDNRITDNVLCNADAAGQNTAQNLTSELKTASESNRWSGNRFYNIEKFYTGSTFFNRDYRDDAPCPGFDLSLDRVGPGKF